MVAWPSMAKRGRVRSTPKSALVTFLAIIGLTAEPRVQGQAESGILRLSTNALPAEVRALSDGRAVVLYRGAFRGYAPAGASDLELRAPDGTVQFQRRVGLDVPDATIITLLDATVSAGGQVVASMVAARPGVGTSHLLAYYSSSSASNAIRLVVTPVACFRLSAATDQGIWCLGPHVERHNSGNPDFQFLHHFSEDGRLLKSVGNRTAFPGAPGPWDNKSQVVATATTVVVWMAGREKLVSFDTNGQILKAAAIPSPPILDDPRTDFILGSDGRLFVLGVTERPTEQFASWRRDLFVFSDQTATWGRTRIQGLGLAIRLVGAFPDRLALWDRDQSQVVRVEP